MPTIEVRRLSSTVPEWTGPLDEFERANADMAVGAIRLAVAAGVTAYVGGGTGPVFAIKATEARHG